MRGEAGTGVPARKRPNQAGGFTPEARAHSARLRYIAIVGRLRQGASQDEVCAEFDVTRAVVFNARRALGVPPDRGRTGHPKPWLRKNGPSEHVARRLRLVARGMSHRRVAELAGVSHQSVTDDVRRWPEELDRMKWESSIDDDRKGEPS